ncbi:MAG: acetate--CoA ligase family protein [Acidobacteria bacterium]|nr:acetate--CoA ligase family protein [Acidobacteriota bacterium]
MISGILQSARARGVGVLSEIEGFEILRALGFETPSQIFVTGLAEARKASFTAIESGKAVVKVVSPDILHKSDVGGVAVIANDPEIIARTIGQMETKFGGANLTGFTVSEFIDYSPALGNELLLGMRWTDDFGAVVTLGAGGIYTDFLTANFKTGKDIAVFSSSLPDDETIKTELLKTAVATLLTGTLRGQKPRLQPAELRESIRKLLSVADEFCRAGVTDFEINPLVVRDQKLIALDILIKLGEVRSGEDNARPVHKIRNLLEPESIAVIGVSEKLNPGHIIVNNLLREEFDRRRIFIVKPEVDSIEGCRCFPDVASLPQTVDLFVISVAAAQVAETVSEIIELEKAESMIIIPGGLEEKSGSAEIVGRMRKALADSRRTAWRGPLINGGNCLGVRSQPGHYDTMFIPAYKLALPKGEVSPVCLISQSGAFVISKGNKLAGINPKYSISLGNQMDVTIGDYLTYLKDDPEIDLFAVYVEGFAPLDGVKFLRAAKEITASGRTVVLYRAGRTPDGAKATSSHTASIAGDYAVTRSLAQSAGVIVAETLNDFEDLTRLFTFLHGSEVSGKRLAAVSNAGFECVAFADNVGAFELNRFSNQTAGRLREIFKRSQIDTIIDAHNPLDLTPMANDAACEDVINALIEDDDFDVVIIGGVPLTPALNTLKADAGHNEDITREGSIVQRLIGLKDTTRKAFVTVVDAGTLYDPMAQMLEEHRIPVFRTADRAMRLFNVYCDQMLKADH